MKRKFYNQPTMKVVKVQHHGMLMTSNSTNATRNSYGAATEDNWE